jgi:uncharacterized lipoprotein YehR (DUF1307 family)
MIKNAKYILIIISLTSLISIINLTGCGGIEGKYVGERGQVIEIKDDGTFVASMDNVRIEGTYEINGDEITLIPSDKKLPLKKGKIKEDQLIDSKGEILNRK